MQKNERVNYTRMKKYDLINLSGCMPFRIGQGYDVHTLVANTPLILGGVTLDYPLGLKGHSDADVLTHAVMDALLGACALGDIGRHFPDSDPRYKGADSIALLKEVGNLLHSKGYAVGNIDATIVAQAPKCAPYLPEMRRHMAQALSIEESNINIKATTEEGLGFTGEGKGIAAKAVALVYRKEFR